MKLKDKIKNWIISKGYKAVVWISCIQIGWGLFETLNEKYFHVSAVTVII